MRVAHAYEAVGDETARWRYDAGGGRAAAGRGDGSEARAHEMFRESFGDEVWRQWSAGSTVRGTLSRDGERVSITIFPDGSVEESTTDARPRRGSSAYSKVTRTDADGRTSSMTSIQLTGSLGDAVAAAVVPDWVADLPGLGPGVVAAVAWAPTLLSGLLCWRCCCAPGRPKDHGA